MSLQADVGVCSCSNMCDHCDMHVPISRRRCICHVSGAAHHVHPAVIYTVQGRQNSPRAAPHYPAGRPLTLAPPAQCTRPSPSMPICLRYRPGGTALAKPKNLNSKQGDERGCLDSVHARSHEGRAAAVNSQYTKPASTCFLAIKCAEKSSAPRAAGRTHDRPQPPTCAGRRARKHTPGRSHQIAL